MVERLMTIAETAVYIGDVSRRTVYRLIGDKKIRVTKIRGGTRIKQSEADRYLRGADRVA